MEIKEINAWSSEAKEKFIELIADQENLIFKPKTTQNGRTFGELLIDDDQYREPYCAAKTLCANSLAISTQNYMNYVNGEFNLNLINCYIVIFWFWQFRWFIFYIVGWKSTLEKWWVYKVIQCVFLISAVEILTRKDFLRLNHELSWRRTEVPINETAENILMNDDVLSIDMRAANTSARNTVNATQNRHPTQSGTNDNSALNGYSLSSTSMTLSVKSLNKLNVLAITDDVVSPTTEWKNAFYFSELTISVLKQSYRNEIDPMCSYGWPHILVSWL